MSSSYSGIGVGDAISLFHGSDMERPKANTREVEKALRTIDPNMMAVPTASGTIFVCRPDEPDEEQTASGGKLLLPDKLLKSMAEQEQGEDASSSSTCTSANEARKRFEQEDELSNWPIPEQQRLALRTRLVPRWDAQVVGTELPAVQDVSALPPFQPIATRYCDQCELSWLVGRDTDEPGLGAHPFHNALFPNLAIEHCVTQRSVVIHASASGKRRLADGAEITGFALYHGDHASKYNEAHVAKLTDEPATEAIGALHAAHFALLQLRNSIPQDLDASIYAETSDISPDADNVLEILEDRKKDGGAGASTSEPKTTTKKPKAKKKNKNGKVKTDKGKGKAPRDDTVTDPWQKPFPTTLHQLGDDVRAIIATDSQYLYDVVTHHMYEWTRDDKAKTFRTGPEGTKGSKVVKHNAMVYGLHKDLTAIIDDFGSRCVEVAWYKIPPKMNKEARALAQAAVDEFEDEDTEEETDN